jgi:hypothetical protein
MSDARWGDPREYGERARDDERPRVYEGRDGDDRDPRDSLMDDLDQPRGEERELVVDRDGVYELNGEDSRTAPGARNATAGAREARRGQIRSERRLRASDTARVRDELMALASAWRRVLVDDPMNSRPIVSSLLKGRVALTPTSEAGWWEARGQGSFQELFTRVFPRGVASPTGFEPVFWP